MRRKLPDPEGINDDRASWALEALQTFQAATGAGDGDAMSDLIADLGHLADRNPEFGSVVAAIRRAAVHYGVETSGGDLLAGFVKGD
jgi:hypothetical protein